MSSAVPSSAVMFVFLLFLLSVVSCHEYYPGTCPSYPPMTGLDWGEFRGDWNAVFKMNSRSSCIRYSFSEVGNTR